VEVEVVVEVAVLTVIATGSTRASTPGQRRDAG